MRKRWPRRLERLRLPLTVVGVLLAMPVLVPVAMIQHGLIQRRQRRRAERSRCVRCDAVLGRAALARSDAEAAAHFAELREKYPHHILRIVRETHAVCAGCGRKYRYDEAADAFLPLAQVGSAD